MIEKICWHSSNVVCVLNFFCFAGGGFNFNFKIFRKFIQRNFLIKYIESVGLAFLVVLIL